MLIGTITAPFGLRGQVRVRSYTDQFEHLRRAIRVVYLGEKRRAYRLRDVALHKPGVLVMTLEGVASRESAEELRGEDVTILESEAMPLAEDEYFLHQLYGMLVVTEAGDELGRVREVIETGANEVLVVARPGQADALIPMIRDVVQELDVAGGRVVIRLIEGLL